MAGVVRILLGEQSTSCVSDRCSNLLGNACKFTQDGNVWIQARAVADGWTFEVRDDGPGIDDVTQASLFVPFTQGQAHTLRGNGTGLGLAISRELVTQMGGRISVESKPDEGATFEVWFPA